MTATCRRTTWCRLISVLLVAWILDGAALHAQGRRKVIIDQDGAGPGGTDMQAIAALARSWSYSRVRRRADERARG